MFVSKWCSKKKLAMALGATMLNAGISFSAHAVTASPAGAVTVTGPISISLSNSSTFNNQTQTANCTLTFSGTMSPSTGNFTVTSAALNSNCGSSVAHFYIDTTQLPRIFTLDLVSRGVATYESYLSISATPWVDFSPSPVVTCWSPFPNLLWSGSQVHATGGAGFGNASGGATCNAGGQLTATPAQTFSS